MADLRWLDGYSGETTDELLALEGQCRTDSIVLAFEEAIQEKLARAGEDALTEEERIVLAVEALEREVNNGGYRQFFVNSSRHFAPLIVPALGRIGCARTAAITGRAIEALHLPSLTVEAIEAATAAGQGRETLEECDSAYYAAGEDLAGRLLAFIRTHRDAIVL